MAKFMMASFKKKKIIIGYKEGKKPNWYENSPPALHTPRKQMCFLVRLFSSGKEISMQKSSLSPNHSALGASLSKEKKCDIKIGYY